MSDPVMLVVLKDANQAQHIVAACQQRMALRPVHLANGAEAARWIGANPCDACVLDYQLPDMDGFDLLARIRQRKPDLPTVMISGAKSEQVAINAFRAGVADVVPKQPGFEASVAQAISQILERKTPSTPGTRPANLDGVPQALAAPNYQNRLRLIGRQLDLQGYHSINLVEVAGGVLVRSFPPGGRTPEALEFPDEQFPNLLQHALAARGTGERTRSLKAPFLTGYEDALRAIGHRLDSRLAEAITVAELGTVVPIGGLERSDGYEQTHLPPYQELLHDDDIGYLLDEAYRRRAQQAPTMASRLGRALGRR
jgi:CheY-like chemotaxis protein